VGDYYIEVTGQDDNVLPTINKGEASFKLTISKDTYCASATLSHTSPSNQVYIPETAQLDLPFTFTLTGSDPLCGSTVTSMTSKCYTAADYATETTCPSLFTFVHTATEYTGSYEVFKNSQGDFGTYYVKTEATLSTSQVDSFVFEVLV